MDTKLALDCLRALSQEHRLAAFRALVQAGEQGLCVGELRGRLGIPGPTLSSHLNQLRAAGLVRDQREGRSIQVAADFARMQALLAFLTENCCAGRACAPVASFCPPDSEAQS
jgi:ArsR family transcriptional regulator, arsenate/arsenite/antimonite-responsive transcriptional repressor